MKNYFLNFLSNLGVALVFILATLISKNNNFYIGVMAFALAFMALDLHVYFCKKLNFINNLFINN